MPAMILRRIYTQLLLAFLLAWSASAASFHTADTSPDYLIYLSELLRVIQFYNAGGYHACPGQNTEDGYCPGPQ